MDGNVALRPATHESWTGIDQLQLKEGGMPNLVMARNKINPEVKENLLVKEPGRAKSDKFYIEL